MRDRFLRCKVGADLVALAGAVALISAAGPPPAGAAIVGAARPIIVLESYVGQRPVNAGLDGRPRVFGSLYDAAGNLVRSAAVTLKRSEELGLRSLARFLARGSAGDGVIAAYAPTPSTRTMGWAGEL